MKIEREINGEIKQIELTDKEVKTAYLEQQHIYDRQVIEDALEYYLNQGEEKEFYKKYEIPLNEVYQNKELIDELAYEMRKKQDKYDLSSETAEEEAFKDVLSEYKEKHNKSLKDVVADATARSGASSSNKEKDTELTIE